MQMGCVYSDNCSLRDTALKSEEKKIYPNRYTHTMRKNEFYGKEIISMTTWYNFRSVRPIGLMSWCARESAQCVKNGSNYNLSPYIHLNLHAIRQCFLLNVGIHVNNVYKYNLWSFALFLSLSIWSSANVWQSFHTGPIIFGHLHWKMARCRRRKRSGKIKYTDL